MHYALKPVNEITAHMLHNCTRCSNIAVPCIIPDGVSRVRIDAPVLSHPRDRLLQTPLLAEPIQIELQPRVVAERDQADPDVALAQSE